MDVLATLIVGAMGLVIWWKCYCEYPTVPFKPFVNRTTLIGYFGGVLAWNLGTCTVLLLVGSLKWNKIKSKVSSDAATKETISAIRVYKPRNVIA